MKAFLLLATVLVAANAVSYDEVFQKEWNLFKTKYGKSYESPEEENYRMSVFKNSKYEVAEHNIRYQVGQESYEMGINEFSDMLPEEVDRIYNGYNRENRLRAKDGEDPELPELDAEVFVPPQVEAPTEVNWISKGAVAPVRHQGSCGSCYAFAALGALEGHQYLKTNKMVVLSPQQLVDCSSSYGNKGCNGGLAANSFNYIKVNGINSESAYPYEAKQGKCRFDKNKVVAKCIGYTQIPMGNEEQLKSAVAMGPVSVSIDASLKTFQSYKNGVFSDPNCSSTRLGHAVLVVGYGTDAATKKDYWLIKNSWGQDWGEKGYVKLARNAKNMCGVATRAVYPKL